MNYVVRHWDDGILYKGANKEKALKVYEEEHYETDGTEYITLFESMKSCNGVENRHYAKFEEI